MPDFEIIKKCFGWLVNLFSGGSTNLFSQNGGQQFYQPKIKAGRDVKMENYLNTTEQFSLEDLEKREKAKKLIKVREVVSEIVDRMTNGYPGFNARVKIRERFVDIPGKFSDILETKGLLRDLNNCVLILCDSDESKDETSRAEVRDALRDMGEIELKIRETVGEVLKELQS